MLKYIRMPIPSIRVIAAVTLCALAGCVTGSVSKATRSPRPEIAQAVAAGSVREARQRKALHLVWFGRPQEARALFEHDARYWAANIHGYGYTSLLKGRLLSDLYAKDDAAARADLARVIAYVGREPAGDALIFKGEVRAAWRAYVDESLHQPSYDMDPVIATGAKEALAGNLAAALAAWSEPATGGGASYDADLRYALIGIADAQMNRWRGAEQAWLLGTLSSRAASVDLSFVWDGNLISLAMLYHYRQYLHRGENAYQWPLPAHIGVNETFEKSPIQP